MANKDFYVAAVGVLPLLFLSLVFEARNDERWQRLGEVMAVSERILALVRLVLSFVLALVMGVGAFAAFVGITHPGESSFAAWHTGWIVAGSLVVAGFAVIALPLVFALAEVIPPVLGPAAAPFWRYRLSCLLFLLGGPAILLYVIFGIGVRSLVN
jgi:hypothetical protein